MGGRGIQVITINNVPTMLCIVNAYMPSDIKEGDYEYRDIMDQLNEVIQKYEETYDFLLCGDMHASLHRDDRRRDRIFKNFTIESNLILPTNYPIDFTFHHHNGKDKSQIDYILFKGKTLNLQPRVSIIPFDAINTSDHTLIKVEITTQISKLAPKSAKIYTKPAWDKCNSENLEYIRCPMVSIWAGNPGICIIRHEEIRTASKGNLQTISVPSRANHSSSHLHTNRGRTNRDNAGQKCNDLVYHLSQA